MASQYTSPATSKTQGVPTVHRIAWFSTIPQLLALATTLAIGWFGTQSSTGMYFGAAVYFIYLFASRKFIPRAHRRGIRLSQAQQFEEAIRSHEESYEFFTRHSWLDRYRSITMMSSSAISYREMALLNIAFAYSQIGNGEKAKKCYQRALKEFPDSVMATAALRMMESVERKRVETEDAR